MTINVTIFADLDKFFKEMISEQAANNIDSVMNMMQPLLLAAFTIYVLFVLWSYWGGSLDSMVQDIIKRIVAWGLILTFSLNLGTYTSAIAPIVQDLGDGLTQAYNGSGIETGSKFDEPLTKILSAFEKKWEEIQNGEEEQVSSEEILSEEKNESEEEQKLGLSNIADTLSSVSSAITNLVPNLAKTLVETVSQVIFILLALIIYILAYAVFAVIAFAYIVIAKLILTLLAIVGPIFIVLAIFPATRQFLSSWINQVVTQGLTIFLMNVFAGMFIAYTDMMIDSYMNDFVLEKAFLFLTVMLIFVVALFKIPEVASGLGGGITSGGYSTAVHTASNSSKVLSKLSKVLTKGVGGKISPK